MLKKLLCLFLCVLMALGSALPVMAANDFNVQLSLNFEKNSYEENEEMKMTVFVENHSGDIKTANLKFKTTSYLTISVDSDVIGTMAEGESISKDYFAKSIDVNGSTKNWFEKGFEKFSNFVYSLFYQIAALFSSKSVCSVITICGVRCAVLIEAEETETPTYAVKFEANCSDATGLPVQQSVRAKDKVQKPSNPTRDGYTFVAWFEDEALSVPYNFDSIVENDITLFAKWNKDEVFYNVFFDYGDVSQPVSVLVKEALTVSEPIEPEREGYLFDGWYQLDSDECFDFSTPIVNDVTLYAHWIEDSFGDTQYAVTFVLNDGDTEGAYDIQFVSPNKKVSEPDIPTKENYVFMGWFLEPSTTEEFDFSTRIKSDLVLYAKWGSPDGIDGVHSSTEGGETVFSITDFRIEEANAIATINVNEMSALVVRFLDENTDEELHIIATQTPEYCELADVSIPINIELPDYFKVVVNLYGADGQLRCAQYVSIEYTSAYEEFESLTVDDFEDKIVINFDEAPDNNFGVLNDDVIQLNQADNVNTLITYSSVTFNEENDATNTYVFTNYNEQVSNLVSGDVILAVDTDGYNQLIKVGYTELDGNAITIYPASESELSDFYDVIKVDTFDEDSIEPIPQTYGRMRSRGIDIIDIDKTLPSATLSLINIDWQPQKWLKVNGTAQGSVQLDVEMVYNLRLFGKDYFKAKIETVAEINVSISVMATIDNSDDVKQQMKEKFSKEFKFVDVPIPTPITGLSVNVRAGVATEMMIEGGLSFNFSCKTTSGYSYDTNSGTQEIDKKERTIDFLKAEGKAEYKIGPKVSVGIGFLGTIVETKVEAHAGAKVTVTADILNLPNYSTAEDKHACTSCFKIEARWFVTVSVKLTYEISEFLSGEVFDFKIIDLEGQILFGNLHSCYISLIHSADSVFGTIAPQFGFGECPNKSYRTTIKLLDSNDNEIEGTTVSIKKLNGKFKSSGSSTFVDYLYDGQYSVTTQINGNSITKTFVVSGSSQEIKLKETSADGKISGKISSAEDNVAIHDATILISKDSLVVKSLKSDSNGNFSASLPDGVYCVEITKDSYITFTQYVSVEESNTTYLNTALLVSGNDSKRGGFSGTITDAVTGKVVKDAKLTIRRGWNNTSYGDVVAVVETDANGLFKYDITKVFGVVFGLESGNYTATVSKEGYATTNFDIVVLPGVVTEGQNAIIAPSAQGNYRIVLKWGSSPSDLDSHLTATTDSGSYEHVYYSNKQGYTSNLDLDDTTSYGPETITITDFESLDGGFTYAVHDFTNKSKTSSKSLSSSGATVQLYKGNTLLKTYYVPTDKVGTVWRVFSINEDGVINDINYFYNQSSASSVR